MRIATSPYELIAQSDGRRRHGALLRIEFKDVGIGYADVHPWPELGDEPLETQLAALRDNKPLPPIIRNSLAFARVDAEARAKGISLFEGLTIPKSHLSLPYGFTAKALEMAKDEGYEIVKLKGHDLNPPDLKILRNSKLRFRLDFNAKLTYDQVVQRLSHWNQPNLDWIDFIEDPCPYSYDHWSSLKSNYGVRLALDFEQSSTRSGFDVRIFKPARQSDENLHRDDPLVITSYLDHPVGQSFAAYSAAQFAQGGRNLEPCGLLTHLVYQPNEFSNQLGIKNGILLPSPGTGIGFDKELASQNWVELS